jgi:hypothetical protein
MVGLHELSDGWVADCTYPEDSVGLPIQKCVVRGLVGVAHKAEIALLQSKMLSHPKEGLELSPAPRKRNSAAVRFYAPSVGTHRHKAPPQSVPTVRVRHQLAP